MRLCASVVFFVVHVGVHLSRADDHSVDYADRRAFAHADLVDHSHRLFKYFLLWGVTTGLSLACGVLFFLLFYYAISPHSRPWRQAELREQLIEVQIRYLNSAMRSYAVQMAIPSRPEVYLAEDSDRFGLVEEPASQRDAPISF